MNIQTLNLFQPYGVLCPSELYPLSTKNHKSTVTCYWMDGALIIPGLGIQWLGPTSVQCYATVCATSQLYYIRNIVLQSENVCMDSILGVCP